MRPTQQSVVFHALYYNELTRGKLTFSPDAVSHIVLAFERRNRLVNRDSILRYINQIPRRFRLRCRHLRRIRRSSLCAKAAIYLGLVVLILIRAGKP